MCLPEAHKRDPFYPPNPFNSELYDQSLKRKLRFAVMREIQNAPTSKSMRRAVQYAKTQLSLAGYEEVEFSPTEEEIAKGRQIILGMCGAYFIRLFLIAALETGEWMSPANIVNMILVSIGPWVRAFLVWLLTFLGEHRIANIVRELKPMDYFEFERLIEMKHKISEEYNKRWLDSGVDVLITPSWVHGAFHSTMAHDFGGLLDHHFFFSVIYSPAGIVPVTTVRRDEEVYEDSINDGWSKKLKETVKGSEGLPICIQVVGFNYEDEKVLAVMKVLEDRLKFYPKPKFI